ncbi:purine catabolism regulatory protein [Pseudonocardia ammonioxydans]|uniref:Purine catabolism regulatory protein n=1 Tax=Pseudonocardia ammonioxydans TaxID=260086 RepID=A0A1I4U294_PSUAM|nr:PucR family transcriptional regulator [Pseudonocardia ammonioxydans]SFM82960.1 purine catabolism regulatory protein [Pseudonocardia ammonioxydans]
MPFTLRDLCADRRLGLRAVCSSADLDRRISWVHSSELRDPTPYLDGGELLLTTGLGPAGDPQRYVARLARHGLAGLGFGTGLGHDEHLPAVTDACTRAGLPLLEVPERTPFLALTRAVTEARAAERFAEVVRTDEAQRALTAAALGEDRDGSTGRVLDRLADRLGAWVLISDADDRVRHAAPPQASPRAAALAGEIARVREHAGPSSVTVSAGGGQVVLQPVRLVGPAVLAVGRDRRFSPVDRQVIGSAVSVLTLAHARSAAAGRAEQRLRTAVLRALATLPGCGAEEVLADTWGPLPDGDLVVVALGGRPAPGRSEILLDALERASAGFHAELDGHVAAVVGADAVEPVLALAARVRGIRAGISDPVPVTGLGRALREAGRALDAAGRRDRAVLRFADLAGSGLAALMAPEDATAFAESVLAPLVRHDAQRRGDLIGSLREWLAHHGQWDPAAGRLGVHRHTLRARIEKAGSLLERDLDSPGVRAELWFALHSREAGDPAHPS